MALAVHLLAGSLLPALLFVRLRRQGMVAALRLHWCGLRPLVFAMMLGAGTSALASLVQWVLGPFPAELWPFIPTTWYEFGWALLLGALGAGVCEEVVFRGVIQGVLSRRGRWPAILITAFLFGALHMNAVQTLTSDKVMVDRQGSLEILAPDDITDKVVHVMRLPWWSSF